MRKNEFDPLAYIESAFLDRTPEGAQEGEDVEVPSIRDYVGNGHRNGHSTRFRRTQMRAPRPRRAQTTSGQGAIDPELQEMLEALPRNLAFLGQFFDDSVTANYYRGEFKETRQDLIRRLLDPQLSLEETARLLGVCPATVRRYTNRGWLAHHRTTGGQRRFRLSDVVRFVETHGRFPEA